MTKVKLHLLPMPISENAQDVIHPSIVKLWNEIDHFFVEDIKTVRRAMKKMDRNIDIDSKTFYVVNEHKEADLDAFDKCLLEGMDMALMSEAGTPAVADPGSELVLYAHDRGVSVKPYVAPSSIILTLESSGMNGNRFSFRGYLSRDKKQKRMELREIESIVFKTGETVLFMDAPYRNNQLLEDITETVNPNLGLCIATELTAPNERISTKTVGHWKNHKPELHKKNVMFALGKLD